MNRILQLFTGVLLVSTLSLTFATAAESVSTRKARQTDVFTVYFENDYFGNEDRHYTNGVKLSWLSSDLETWGLHGWRQRFAEWLPFVNRAEGQKNLGLALGQNIYTPEDIGRNPPDPTDRPYAGWSYLEFTFISKTPAVMDTFSIQLGMVGRHSYAQDTQRIVHEWLNDERPQGWDYQIRDEFGLNLVYERKWRLYTRSFGQALGADFTPHVGASLGNVQSFANAGFSARLGFNLPSDFGVSLIKASSGTGSPIDDDDVRVKTTGGWSVFGFGGVDGRAIGRDIFLDGNTFKDSRSVAKERFVADLFYGFGVVVGRWQFTFTKVVRTREFEAQADLSHYGSVTLSRTF